MRRENSSISTSLLSAGSRFDELILSRRHRPDYQIILFMGLLMLLGLVIIYAIGPQRANVLNNAYGSDYSDTYFFIKQATSLLAALGSFVIASFLPIKLFAKYAKAIFIFSLGLCLLLAFADLANLEIAKSTLGATRWFNLGILGSFQPSEVLKFGLLIFLSMFLGGKIRDGKLNDVKETLIPTGIFYGISMLFIVVIQNDLGTGLALTGLVMAMLVIGKINFRNFIKITAILLALGVSMIMIAPHRMERIITFIQGDNSATRIDSQSDNYHVEHAKLAIGSGGLFGVGIGNSIQATGYLPEAINDSVFAIIGETFGFVGLVVILSLFSALLIRLLKVMDHLEDIRIKLFVAGVFGWISVHVILNIASMTGLVPLTGITLPLLSFGGTSLLLISIILGLVFQLSRYTVYSSNLKEVPHENISSRRGIGRSRNSNNSSFRRN